MYVQNLRSLVCATLCAISATTLGAEGGSAPEADPCEGKIRVGLVVSPPMVMNGAEAFHGVAVEIWKQAALVAGLHNQYCFVEMHTLGELFPALGTEVDVLIGGLSITGPREHYGDFTVPYLETGLSIATMGEERFTLAQFRDALTSLPTVVAFSVFVGMLLVGTPIIWLLEHAYSENVDPHFWWKGCGDAFRMMMGYLVTDQRWKAERHLTDLIFMIPAPLVFSLLILGVAGGVFIEHFNTVWQSTTGVASYRDLDQRTVAIKASGAVHSAVRAVAPNATIVDEPGLAGAFESLLAGSADAVVYDELMLKHHLKEHATLLPGVRTVGETFARHSYAFMVAHDKPELLEQLNLTIHEVRAHGTVHALVRDATGP